MSISILSTKTHYVASHCGQQLNDADRKFSKWPVHCILWPGVAFLPYLGGSLEALDAAVRDPAESLRVAAVRSLEFMLHPVRTGLHF